MADIRRVWVTRAQPGADRTAGRLTDLGCQPVVAPVLTIRPLPFIPPAPETVAALAFTSANGVAAFTKAAGGFRGHPVFTVGAATAEAARAAGFTHVQSADGDAQALARLVAEAAPSSPVLVPGAAQPAADLQSLIGSALSILQLPVYDAAETDIPAPDFDAVLIHSPRAARTVAARLSPEAAHGRIAIAISPAAAEPLAAFPFAERRIAAAPTEASLLARLGNPGPTV
jgi:uroporphyrinogen-III synthase